MNNTTSNKTTEKCRQEEMFIHDIISTAAGKRVLSCIQCGTCTATCPVSKVSENSPRQIFLMVRNGMKKEVLSNLTPWVCASCYKCTVNCPAQIKITEVMYQLKRMAIKNKLVSHKSDTKLFYASFINQVMRYGRSFEVGLMLKYMGMHHPANLMKQAPLGMRMMMQGALPLMPHKIKKQKQFHKIMDHAMKLEMTQNFDSKN